MYGEGRLATKTPVMAGSTGARLSLIHFMPATRIGAVDVRFRADASNLPCYSVAGTVSRGDAVSNSVDKGPQETSDRGSAVRTSMLLVGLLVAGVSLLHLPTSLMSQANTQVEASPPIVKASDKWIGLGVDASSSQVPTALSQ
jgi:hypothetical protein